MLFIDFNICFFDFLIGMNRSCEKSIINFAANHFNWICIDVDDSDIHVRDFKNFCEPLLKLLVYSILMVFKKKVINLMIKELAVYVIESIRRIVLEIGNVNTSSFKKINLAKALIDLKELLSDFLDGKWKK